MADAVHIALALFNAIKRVGNRLRFTIDPKVDIILSVLAIIVGFFSSILWVVN